MASTWERAVVDDLRGQQADARVTMLGVVPAEEVLLEGAGLLDGGEAVREAGPVLQSLELRLGVRVVVRDTELLRRQRWATRQQARTAIVEYIEAFYNRQRRHSTLGYLSPADFEDRYHRQAAA